MKVVETVEDIAAADRLVGGIQYTQSQRDWIEAATTQVDTIERKNVAGRTTGQQDELERLFEAVIDAEQPTQESAPDYRARRRALDLEVGKLQFTGATFASLRRFLLGRIPPENRIVQRAELNDPSWARNDDTGKLEAVGPDEPEFWLKMRAVRRQELDEKYGRGQQWGTVDADGVEREVPTPAAAGTYAGIERSAEPFFVGENYRFPEFKPGTFIASGTYETPRIFTPALIADITLALAQPPVLKIFVSGEDLVKPPAMGAFQEAIRDELRQITADLQRTEEEALYRDGRPTKIQVAQMLVDDQFIGLTTEFERGWLLNNLNPAAMASEKAFVAFVTEGLERFRARKREAEKPFEFRDRAYYDAPVEEPQLAGAL